MDLVPVYHRLFGPGARLEPVEQGERELQPDVGRCRPEVVLECKCVVLSLVLIGPDEAERWKEVRPFNADVLVENFFLEGELQDRWIGGERVTPGFLHDLPRNIVEREPAGHPDLRL